MNSYQEQPDKNNAAAGSFGLSRGNIVTDVLKNGGVSEAMTKTKDSTLKDIDDFKAAFAEKITENMPIAFYSKKTLPMSIGERVRLTESATDKNRESAKTYIITDINAENLFLKEVSADGTNIQLEHTSYPAQHIDYAYTVTSHHTEGATEKASFTAQASIYRHLATTQAYLNVLHSGAKTLAMKAVGRGASDASINRLEQPLVSYYEQMFEELFDCKATKKLKTIQKDGFLVHYDRESKTLQWTKLATRQQGEGFLSYIQCKEKLTHQQMQSYAVIILADYQAKQCECEKQPKKNLNELSEMNESADHRSIEDSVKSSIKEKGYFWGQDIQMEL